MQNPREAETPPQTASATRTPTSGDRGSWPALAVTLTYWALSYGFTRFRDIFEIDPDEGNNLIKALLLDRGHAFLTEIWSDQPPLFPHLLWGA
ncbi:MAG TPA: hypothetical protein VFQ61_05790, partial [Polyangiaceae bacterium]|nr:hypothetical protein [Polyangiaceae bacterium]